MHFRKVLPTLLLISGSCSLTNAQSFVPPNMDFETGTTANWTFYRGSVASGHVFSLTTTPAVPGLHTITSGTGTDMYGGFPVVGAGSYSLKLSHDTIDMNADAASYNIHVPTTGAYSLIYHYAAVLEDTIHAPSLAPIMKVNAIDSATGAKLPDSLMVYPNSAGFVHSTTGGDVFYKAWTTDSINLAGYAGHTITVKFIAAACGEGAHLGYGYIDVTNVALHPGSLGTPLTANSDANISIYPNPASGRLNVKWANQQTGAATIAITDATGRMILHTGLDINATSGETQIDLSRLAAGVYSVNIVAGKNTFSDKLVIQK